MEKSQIPSVGKRSWLPYCEQTQQLKFSALIGEEVANSRWPRILKKRYTEFSNICCVTSRFAAQRIIVRDGIKPKRETILAWSSESAMRNLELSFVLFTPNTRQQVLEFGERNYELMFAKFVIPVEGDAGIIDKQFRRCHGLEDPNDDIYYWNHYFLEILDTETKSFCRILASKNCYDHLITYDPTELGGPWYWDLTNNKHYYMNETQGYGGHQREVIVEFLRESDVIGLSKPGPDWSVVWDIEFLFAHNTKKSMRNEDHTEKNKSCLGNQSTVVNSELACFFAWYNGLPTNKTKKLNDISGLKEASNLPMYPVSPVANGDGDIC